MPRSHKEVEILIIKLEQSLREEMLWSSSTPPDKALQSILPFALDTLSFEQWLQFVFIPKIKFLLKTVLLLLFFFVSKIHLNNSGVFLLMKLAY